MTQWQQADSGEETPFNITYYTPAVTPSEHVDESEDQIVPSVERSASPGSITGEEKVQVDHSGTVLSDGIVAAVATVSVAPTESPISTGDPPALVAAEASLASKQIFPSQSTPSFSQTGVSPSDLCTFSNIEFLLLSKICTMIDAKFSITEPVSRSPGTVSIAKFHTTDFLDGIFEQLTRIPELFPHGPRYYSFYCNIMEKLAQMSEDRGYTMGATMALGLLQRGFEKQHNQAMASTCLCMYKLARIFDETGNRELAELNYRSACRGFEEVENDGRLISQKRQDQQLKCGCSFVNFLEKTGKNNEALNILLVIFAKSFWRSCDQASTKALLDGVALSLETHLTEIDIDGKLIAALSGLRANVFQRPLSRSTYFDFVKLASGLSILGRFDNADFIFGIAFTKVPTVEHWSITKIALTKHYLEHYQRHNKWAQSLALLQSALESLTAMSSYDDLLVSSLDRLLGKAKAQLDTTQDLEILQKLADTEAALCHQHRRRGEESLEVEEIHEELKERRREEQKRFDNIEILRTTIGDWVLPRDDEVSGWSRSRSGSSDRGVTYPSPITDVCDDVFAIP